MQQKTAHYGLPTAVSMIIGIVVGSGIVFKSPTVLKATGGSVPLGVLAFCIAAISIVFGSITLSQLSVRTEKNGGAVGFFEDFVSLPLAAAFGWFQTFVYLPTMSAVVSWVAGIYTCALFTIESTLEIQVLLGLFYMILLYGVNVISLRWGGYIQNLSTAIKLVPLVIIAFVGLLFGAEHPDIPAGVAFIGSSEVGMGWLAALIPIAFSFDGWIVSLSITNEVKNPKRTMPLALTLGPILCLVIYVCYFVGITNMLGSEYIMSMGKESVTTAAEMIFGGVGGKVITVAVLISILGVVNGLILGMLRMPQALATKHMIPGAAAIAPLNPKTGLSNGSCLVAFGSSLAYLLIHYAVMKSGILGNYDISEIAIAFSYVCYIVLYWKVLKMGRAGEISNPFLGKIAPVMGMLGSAIIMIGAFIANPTYVPVFVALCLISCFAGFGYYRSASRKRA